MKLLPGTITHSWLPASRDGAAGGERLWRAFPRSAGTGLGWRRLRRGRKHSRTDPCPHSRVLCWHWECCGLGSTTPSQGWRCCQGSVPAPFQPCQRSLNIPLLSFPSEFHINPVTAPAATQEAEGAHRGHFIFSLKLSHWTLGLWCFGRVTQHCWSFQHIQVIEMFLDSCWLCCGMWFIRGGISSGNISK